MNFLFCKLFPFLWTFSNSPTFPQMDELFFCKIFKPFLMSQFFFKSIFYQTNNTRKWKKTLASAWESEASDTIPGASRGELLTGALCARRGNQRPCARLPGPAQKQADELAYHARFPGFPARPSWLTGSGRSVNRWWLTFEIFFRNFRERIRK